MTLTALTLIRLFLHGTSLFHDGQHSIFKLLLCTPRLLQIILAESAERVLLVVLWACAIPYTS